MIAIGLAVLLRSVVGDIPALSSQLSKLNAFNTSSYATLLTTPSFSYIKISTKDLSDAYKSSVFITSGLYAGYQQNIDFVYNFTANILAKLNSSDSETTSILKDKILYVIPIINEPAYKAMQSYWNATGIVGVFQTDQTLGAACNGTNDTGINVDHNFIYKWENTSATNCSAQYAGVYALSSGVCLNLYNLITGKNVIGLINYNLNKDLYVTPYTNDSSNSTLSSFQSYLYAQLGGQVPSAFKYGSLYGTTGNSSSGSLLDQSSNLGLVSLESGIVTSTDLHTTFLYKYLSFLSPMPNVSYIYSQFQKTNSSANVTTENITILLNIKNNGCITMSRFQVSVSLNSSDLINLVNSTVSNYNLHNNSVNSETLSIQLGTNQISFYMDLYGYAAANLTFNYVRGQNFGTSINGSVTLAYGVSNAQSLNAVFVADGKGSSTPTVSSNSSSESSSGSSKKSIIIAASILIAINILVILVSLGWKWWKNSKLQ